ncbi:hypothetical protein HID58_024816 [Brassica napus]|uniref:Uncharacterized protein n=1 Tax=Brassica napus TaxID=3708 RepID=A0ABQ8CJC0_BRANA|nr:hypothetical protein HID58_024816 [Brassica napus]
MSLCLSSSSNWHSWHPSLNLRVFRVGRSKRQ